MTCRPIQFARVRSLTFTSHPFARSRLLPRILKTLLPSESGSPLSTESDVCFIVIELPPGSKFVSKLQRPRCSIRKANQSLHSTSIRL